MFVQSVIGFVLSIPFLDIQLMTPSIDQIKYIVFLGGVVNFGAFYLQLFGQRKLEASNTALILSLEAVFATLFGLIFVGEVLSTINWVGILFTFISIYHSSKIFIFSMMIKYWLFMRARNYFDWSIFFFAVF